MFMSRYQATFCHGSMLTGFGRTHRPLLVALPDAEGVLKDAVHDPADPKRRLNDVGHHFLHCGKGDGSSVRPPSAAANPSSDLTV